MFKKLSASIFVLALVTVAVAPAQAQSFPTEGTLGVYFAPLSGAADDRFGVVGAGEQFDIVVKSKIDQPSCSSEFVMTEFLVEVPGVLKLGTVKVNNTPLDLGDNKLGEYILAYGVPCPSGEVELVRVTYGTFGGEVPPDFVLKLRGIEPGDSQPSSFNGEGMGWVSPAPETKYLFEPEPWPDGLVGNIDPAKLPDGGAGACVLNADTVPTDANSMSSLKSRF